MSFASRWKGTGRPASGGATLNWKPPRRPRKRPDKKGFTTAFGIEIVTEIEALLGTGVVMVALSSAQGVAECCQGFRQLCVGRYAARLTK